MGARKAPACLIVGVVGRGCCGTSCPSVQKTWQSLLGAQPSAEPSAEPDYLQRPLVPRSRFRQQVSASVRRHCNALDNDERRQIMLTNHMNHRVFLGASVASAVMMTAGTALAQQ